MSTIQLLHGTDHIIEVPDINIGNPHNDYGRGFYCTRVEEMAREWACKKNTDGFVNVYDFDGDGLKVLNLLSGNHTVLNWIALLLQFRTFKLDSEVAVDARDYIIEHYSVDLSGYDIVVGYRADDSYFQYAESFVSNTLPLRSLNKALRLGKLGEQTVVISQRGFERLKFVDAYSVDKNVYYPKFLDRDTKARDTYRKEIKKTKSYRDDIFVLDILREEMSNDDPRIQRVMQRIVFPHSSITLLMTARSSRIGLPCFLSTQAMPSNLSAAILPMLQVCPVLNLPVRLS